MIQSSAAASEEEESQAAAINWQSNGLGFSFYTPAQVFCVAQILNFFLAFLHPVPSCNCGAFFSLSSQRRFYKPSTSVGAATAAMLRLGIGWWYVIAKQLASLSCRQSIPLLQLVVGSSRRSIRTVFQLLFANEELATCLEGQKEEELRRRVDKSVSQSVSVSSSSSYTRTVLECT